MSRTISNAVPGPVVLVATDNPLTITSSGSVISTTGTAQSPVDAIDGGAGTSWAITNSGIVSSSFGYGVSLAGAGSSVTNSGSISGTGQDSFNNISGVSITGASGTVTNGGTIAVSGGGYGVHLAGGGAVTNSGSVTGGEDGVLIEGAPGRINNTGAISARVDDGAALFAGGTITNSATGSIEGLAGPVAAGVFIQGGSGNLQNDGIVKGNNFGAFLAEGGSVTNGAGDASANISGGSVGGSETSFGLFVASNPATVTNYGTIDGAGAAESVGAELDQGGNVTNNSGGTISGTGFGVFIESNSASSATVTNAGAVSGAIASVEFAGTGANTLTLQTGSTLTGDAIGSTAGGATNALMLQGSGTANNNFDNFNTLDVQKNASWTLGGDSTFSGTTVNRGSVLVSSGTLDLEGAVSGNGTDTISGSTLEFDSTVGGGQTIDFSGGALDLLDPQGFSGKIAGFASPDMVQLAGDWNFSHFSETGNGMMGNLTLSSGGTTNTFHFLGDYTASDFSIASGATTIIGHT